MSDRATPSDSGEKGMVPHVEQKSNPDPSPSVSVIIPTFNRATWLGELLASLALQTLPFDQFEVIVVDDGSTDNTQEITTHQYPFRLRYIYQPNQGDAAARNFGAQHSSAEILVFFDDDIILEKDFLVHLLAEQRANPHSIMVGTDTLWVQDTNPMAVGAVLPGLEVGKPAVGAIPFAEVCSNNMSIRREAYFEIGMMEGLNFPGSSIWCDVDFTYRAYRKKFAFLRSYRALCWHRDYVAKSLENRKKRMYQVAYRAVVLFQKYPELVYYLPMFSDKTPVNLKDDSFGIIVRKFVRHLTSSKWFLWLLEGMYRLGHNRPAFAALNDVLGRWIAGGYIFRGYRDGLRDFGPVHSPPRRSVLSSVEQI